MLWARPLIAALALFSATGVSHTARAAGSRPPMIQIGNGFETPPGFLLPVMDMLGSVFRQFFSEFVPSHTGAANPNMFEKQVEEYVRRIGDSRFQLLLSGVGNLHFLGSRYYYQEFQGGAGIEFDFTAPDDPHHFLALRVSPLYGEIAWIRVERGFPDEPGMPTAITLGGSIGIEGRESIGIVDAGARLYVRPGIEITGSHDWGTAASASFYLRFRLGELLQPKLPIFLTAAVDYQYRGGMNDSIYDWSHERGVRDPANVLQGMLFLEWKAE